MFMTNYGFILIWYFGFEVVNLLHYKRVYIKEDIYQTEFIKVFFKIIRHLKVGSIVFRYNSKYENQYSNIYTTEVPKHRKIKLGRTVSELTAVES